jgi:hypothetical protein
LRRQIVHEVRDDKSDHGLEDDGGHGEQDRLLDHHPECVAFEQELEISKPDKPHHRFVQGRQVNGVKGRVDHQASNNHYQWQRHQERDRRFAPGKFLYRQLPASRRDAEVTGYDVCHPFTPSL